MKFSIKSIAVCFFFFTIPIIGQEKQLRLKDSISTFYTKLFEDLKANYLYTKEVKWPAIQSYILKEALKAKTFEESLKQSTKLFDTIQGNHLILFSEDENWYKTSKLGKQLTGDMFNESTIEAYENKKSFETKVLNNHYGYVFIPGMLLKDLSRQELDEVSQKIYDGIVKIDNSHNIKGWIVDLRVNVGGNSNVMLTGLYHLLGNGAAYLTLNNDKSVRTLNSFHEGVLYKNHKENNAVIIAAKPKPSIPVALLSGVLTNSAGEFVILSFRGRKNTIVIGEESYGNTTSNSMYEMPFGRSAAITETYATDRFAKFTKTIVPDIEVIKQTNFEDLSKDKNIIEAIKFIDSN